MKLTLDDIATIQSLESEFNSLTLPAALAYKLSKLFIVVTAEYKTYADALKSLLEKYALRDENNQLVVTDDGVKLQEDKIQIAQEELNELNNVEINIDTTFSLNELDKLPLTFAQFKIFSKLISE